MLFSMLKIYVSFQNYGILRLTSLAEWKGWVAQTTVLRPGSPADEGSQPVKCHCAARGGTTADAIPEVDCDCALRVQ